MKKRLMALFVVFLMIFSTGCGKKSPTWQEQYDLGIRYLSKGNYEEAIIAFTAAIEIDPKNPEAYLKAAEAYEALGDSEAAKAILEKGYDETGDESLLPQEPTSLWMGDNFITPEELTFAGIPFYEIDLYTAAEHLSGDSDGRFDDWGNGIGWTGNPSLAQGKDEDVLLEVQYYNHDSHPPIVQPEFRNIYTAMPMVEMLENLGFTPYLIEKIQKVLDGDTSEIEEDKKGSLIIFKDGEPFHAYPGVEFELVTFFSRDNDEVWISMAIEWDDRDHHPDGFSGEIRCLFQDGQLYNITLVNYYR